MIGYRDGNVLHLLHWLFFFVGKGDKVAHLKFHKTGQEKHGFNLPGNLITSRTAQE